jgi:hypothetical protein
MSSLCLPVWTVQQVHLSYTKIRWSLSPAWRHPNYGCCSEDVGPSPNFEFDWRSQFKTSYD